MHHPWQGRQSCARPLWLPENKTNHFTGKGRCHTWLVKLSQRSFIHLTTVTACQTVLVLTTVTVCQSVLVLTTVTACQTVLVLTTVTVCQSVLVLTTVTVCQTVLVLTTVIACQTVLITVTVLSNCPYHSDCLSNCPYHSDCLSLFGISSDYFRHRHCDARQERCKHVTSAHPEGHCHCSQKAQHMLTLTLLVIWSFSYSFNSSALNNFPGYELWRRPYHCSCPLVPDAPDSAMPQCATAAAVPLPPDGAAQTQRGPEGAGRPGCR